MRTYVSLLVIGVLILVAALIVLVIHRDFSTDLLGGIAFLGGLAVIVNALKDVEEREEHKND